jgi:hypothetical protein
MPQLSEGARQVFREIGKSSSCGAFVGETVGEHRHRKWRVEGLVRGPGGQASCGLQTLGRFHAPLVLSTERNAGGATGAGAGEHDGVSAIGKRKNRRGVRSATEMASWRAGDLASWRACRAALSRAGCHGR